MSRARQVVAAVVSALFAVCWWAGAAGPAVADGLASTGAVPTEVVLPSPSPSGPDTTSCTQPTNGYAPRGPCQLTIARAQSQCVGGAPVLDYAVVPQGTPNTTVTLTWINPGGPDLSQAGLPLTGRVLWPGTVIEGGQVVDWPGWHRTADGGWAQGDEYDWVRPGVQLRFQVNPTATTTVTYPPETAPCSGPSSTPPRSTPPGSTPPGTPAGPGSSVPSGGLDQVLNVPGTAVAATSPQPPVATLPATGADIAPVMRAAGWLVGIGAVLTAIVRLRARYQTRRDR